MDHGARLIISCITLFEWCLILFEPVCSCSFISMLLCPFLKTKYAMMFYHLCTTFFIQTSCDLVERWGSCVRKKVACWNRVLGFVNSFWCMDKVEDECMACFDWPWFGFVFQHLSELGDRLREGSTWSVTPSISFSFLFFWFIIGRGCVQRCFPHPFILANVHVNKLPLVHFSYMHPHSIFFYYLIIVSFVFI